MSSWDRDRNGRRSYGWIGLGAALSLGLGLWACSSSPTAGTGGSGTTGGTTSTTTSATTTTATSTTTTTTGTGGGSTTGTGGGGPCNGCMAVATLPIGSAPQGLFIDADNVYWTNAGTGEVMQAKKDGSAPVTLATMQGTPYSVFVSAGFAYWISYSGDGVMRKAPVGGGAVIDIVGAPGARDLVVADGRVFWSREPDDIESVPIDGLPDGGMTTLLSMNTLSNGITADQEMVYWVNRQDGTVKKANFMLGSDAVLGVGDEPWDVAVDGVNAYWTERAGSIPGTGKVSMAKKSDGSGMKMLATTEDGPRGIAVDDTHVYWANQEGGTIRRAPIAGGPVETVASAQEKPVNVAVDGTHVYWTNSAGDTVMRVAK